MEVVDAGAGDALADGQALEDLDLAVSDGQAHANGPPGDPASVGIDDEDPGALARRSDHGRSGERSPGRVLASLGGPRDGRRHPRQEIEVVGVLHAERDREGLRDRVRLGDELLHGQVEGTARRDIEGGDHAPRFARVDADHVAFRDIDTKLEASRQRLQREDRLAGTHLLEGVDVLRGDHAIERCEELGIPQRLAPYRELRSRDTLACSREVDLVRRNRAGVRHRLESSETCASLGVDGASAAHCLLEVSAVEDREPLTLLDVFALGDRDLDDAAADLEREFGAAIGMQATGELVGRSVPGVTELHRRDRTGR